MPRETAAPLAGSSAARAWAWLRTPAELELRLGLRVRAYAWMLALVAASVPFLHLYIAVELEPAELALHTLDIAGGALFAVLVLELLVGLEQRRRDWHFAASRGGLLLGAGLAAALAWALSGSVHEWLPHTDAIRARHVQSGYEDMSLRVAPLVALIAWLVLQAVRRDALAREIASLRQLNRALGERAAASGSAAASPPEAGAAEPRIALRHEGGEIVVRAADVVRVSAQENYCEFALAASAEDGGEPRRPWVRMTLAEALARLPADDFVQTHRSHGANLARVREIRRDGRSCELRLEGGESVPVARARLAEVRERVAAQLASTQLASAPERPVQSGLADPGA